VSGQLHIPAALKPAKEPGEAGGPHSQSVRCDKKKKGTPSPPGNRIPVVSLIE